MTTHPELSALRELERDGTLSQRDLAARLGVSLGRTNFLVRALIARGLVKARRFKNSRNKLAYRYALTPEGMREKVRVARRFLDLKVLEYERLRREIAELEGEVGSGPPLLVQEQMAPTPSPPLHVQEQMAPAPYPHLHVQGQAAPAPCPPLPRGEGAGGGWPRLEPALAPSPTTRRPRR